MYSNDFKLMDADGKGADMPDSLPSPCIALFRPVSVVLPLARASIFLLEEEEEERKKYLTSVGSEAQSAGKYYHNPCNILIGSETGPVPTSRGLLIKESTSHITN
jgi:hypothetical protein